ncbi:MAG: efflux transporter periplasmic adaptor subunit, partial [Muribaculaceae bacterium]|nr:efflux transporter periplasmic adaptor subunit [Muribaculaceae bacterium]
QEARGVMSVPESVIEFEGDKAFVYVLVDEKEQTFERKPVEVGLSDGINIEVTGGITATDRLRGGARK